MGTIARRLLAGSAAAVVLVLPACSAEDDTNADDTDRGDPTATKTVDDGLGQDESESAPSDSPKANDGVTSAVDGRVVEQGQLSSPSGNIWCSLEYGIECWVFENSYDPIARPKDCDYDWAENQFLVTDTAGVRGICRSDSTFDAQPPVLPYGTTSILNDAACASTKIAMLCWDIRSGHGFRVSRASYDLY